MGDVAVQGPRALLTSWQLYTVLVIGVLGLLLNQLAFQAGPLTASLPAIATVNPLASITIGVLVYDETVRHSLEASVGLGLLLLLLGTAVIQLTRSGDNPCRPDSDHPSQTAACCSAQFRDLSRD